MWKLHIHPRPLTVMTKDRKIGTPGDASDERFDFFAASHVYRSELPAVGQWPRWARWNGRQERRYTLGVEEEVLLLNRSGHSLSESSEAVLAQLSEGLRSHTFLETHAAVI